MIFIFQDHTRSGWFFIGVLGNNASSGLRWAADTGIVLSTNTEVILVVFNQILDLQAGVSDGLLVDFHPAGSKRLKQE